MSSAIKKISIISVCLPLMTILLVGCIGVSNDSLNTVSYYEDNTPEDALPMQTVGPVTYRFHDGNYYVIAGLTNPNENYIVRNYAFNVKHWDPKDKEEQNTHSPLYDDDIVFPELMPGETRYTIMQISDGKEELSTRSTSFNLQNVVWELTDQEYVNPLKIANVQTAYKVSVKTKTYEKLLDNS